jgi:hypothetical protein
VRNRIVDTINTTFATLGNANGMRMPKAEDNRESYAWNMWVAKHVQGLANKRWDHACKLAADAGVINDKEKNPRPASTKALVYNGEYVSVLCEVRSAARRVDVDKLVDFLELKGVQRALLDAAVEQATKESKPAHVFSPMLNAED